jgi:hypothetical protein
MHNPCTFEAISGQFKSKNEYQKYLSECLENYDLKVYRVHTMTIDQAINYYKDLKDKYSYVKMKVRLRYLSKNSHFLVLE